MKILLLEQEQKSGYELQQSLLTEGYGIDVATDWEFCWQLIELFEYDLVLLDLSSLDGNAIKFCQSRRLAGDQTPIVMLGILDSEQIIYSDLALHSGATDYLTKPIAIDSLIATLKKRVCEKSDVHPSVIQWQDIKLNFLDCQASYQNQSLYLNSTELALLTLLVKNRDHISSLPQILTNLWGVEDNLSEHEIELHLEQLRQKLQKAGAPVGIIEKIYGLGYCLKTGESHFSAISELDFAPETIALKLPETSPRLLIIDPDHNVTRSLTKEANYWGIEAQVVQNVTQARVALAQDCPNIVLLDLPVSNTSEQERLLAELARANPPIPVVVTTVQESLSERLRVAQMGGQGFLHKPIAPDLVLETIIQLLQHQLSPVGTLMIVASDSYLLDSLSHLLSPWGFKLIFLRNLQQFWNTLEQTNPDLLILDFELSEVGGLELCRIVRQAPQWNNLPILMLSAVRKAQIVQKVFEVGADDFIHKPIVGPELIARILNRLERSQIHRQRSDTDGLTKINNRRKAIQEIDRLFRIAKRQHQSLCFALLDLDHFKSVNDRYGHEIGDQVLKKFGELLKRFFREEDVICRWGGEEFALCLYGIEKKQASGRLRQFLELWGQQIFMSKEQGFFHITFSAGIAQYPTDGDDLQGLYQAADTALYRAKEQGRNQVQVF